MAAPNPEIYDNIQNALNKKIWSMWLTIGIKTISLLVSLVFFIIIVMTIWHGGVILVGESPKDCFIFGKIYGIKRLFN